MLPQSRTASDSKCSHWLCLNPYNFIGTLRNRWARNLTKFSTVSWSTIRTQWGFRRWPLTYWRTTKSKILRSRVSIGVRPPLHPRWNKATSPLTSTHTKFSQSRLARRLKRWSSSASRARSAILNRQDCASQTPLGAQSVLLSEDHRRIRSKWSSYAWTTRCKTSCRWCKITRSWVRSQASSWIRSITSQYSSRLF